MKITRRQLRQIIKEELGRLNEERGHPGQAEIEVIGDLRSNEDQDLINIVNKAKQEYWESVKTKIAAILTSHPDVWSGSRPALGDMWSEISSIEDFKLITHDDVRHLGPVGQKVFVGDPYELHLIRESSNSMIRSLYSAYDNLPEKQ